MNAEPRSLNTIGLEARLGEVGRLNIAMLLIARGR